ncbi:MAG TPA: hypothetical protein VL172_04795 [Kofleriaceae bacterium]|jgi:hypothetical protein|nr:hypothetical protein [Kofleriaceae bacterium]
MPRPTSVSNAHVLASVPLSRLATLGAALQLPLGRLLETVSGFPAELSRMAAAIVSADFDRIRVVTVTDAKEPVVARMIELAGSIDRDQPRRLDELIGQAERIALTVGTVAGRTDALTLAIDGWGRRSLDEDLESLARVSRAPAAELDRLGQVARPLAADGVAAVGDQVDGDGKPSWNLRLRHRNSDDQQRSQTRARLDGAAEMLGISTAQRNLVAGLHDVLCRGRDSWSRLQLDGERLQPTLAVLWSDVPWEHAVRILIGLVADEGATRRLGAVAGAADTEMAAQLELELRPDDPPRMNVTVDLGKGS